MIEDILDAYVDVYGEKAGVELLVILADPSCGGQGYELRAEPMIDFDGYEVSHERKVIRLDTTNFGFERQAKDIADDLEESLNVQFRRTHSSLLSRIGWGTGKVILGVVETAVGAIGIIVPEPGTTAGGVVLVTLGTNTLVDGFSQLAGANNGHGYNILGEGAGYVGENIAEFAGYDPTVGRAVGQGTFVVTSVALGSWGSIRVLRIPGQSFFRAANSGERFRIGRLEGLYRSQNAKDGMTIININDNAGKSILRFVTHSGQLQANGRIFGVERVLRHTPMGKDMIKGLLKLVVHGFKNGL